MFKLDANHLSRYLTLVCNRLVALQAAKGALARVPRRLPPKMGVATASFAMSICP